MIMRNEDGWTNEGRTDGASSENAMHTPKYGFVLLALINPKLWVCRGSDAYVGAKVYSTHGTVVDRYTATIASRHCRMQRVGV